MMMFPYLITPWLPTNCDLPPTIYSLLNSICNFDSVDKTNIYNLARVGRTKIFDFTYPLTNKVSKEEFERHSAAVGVYSRTAMAISALSVVSPENSVK